MANEILQKAGTQLRFCVSGSFSPADNGTNWTSGSPTNVVLTQNALANNAGRQSDKCDLGATWASGFDVYAAFDFTGETPTTTGWVEYWWMPSPVSTQGDGNIAGNSGQDGAAPHGALGSITLDEMVLQSQYIGRLKTHDGGVVQNGYVGRLYPRSRYGQLLVYNKSGDVAENDDVENHVVFQPCVEEIQ